MKRSVRSRMGRAPRGRGAALVEFAIALPMLLFAMTVVAEFGRVFWQYSTLTNAARDATRYLANRAIRNGTGLVTIPEGLATEVKNLVIYGQMTAGTIPVVPGLASGNITVESVVGGDVRVTVVYPYQGIFGGSVPGIGIGSVGTVFDLRVVSVMKALA